MTQENGSKADKSAKSPRAQHREDRLKAALKANMAKRKAQKRARADDATVGKTNLENDKG